MRKIALALAAVIGLSLGLTACKGVKFDWRDEPATMPGGAEQ